MTFLPSLMSRGTTWARATSQTWMTYLIVIAGFATSYSLSAWARPLFAPDSRYYYGMALHFGGMSQESAAAEVAALSATFGWESPPADQLFGWGLVQPRVVLPVLAAPFVKLFGVNGLAVVTGLALFAMFMVITALLCSRYGPIPAAGTMLVLASSTQVMFYGAAMITESLSALWTALIVVVAFKHVRDPRVAYLVGLVALTALSAFTRQATFIPAGALCVAWFAGLFLHREQRWGGPALAVTATAVGLQVLQTRIFPTFSQENQYLRMTKTDNLPDALAATPGLAWDIMATNARQWAGADLAVPVLGAVAIVSMIVLWRRAESHLLLGALLASALYNITNGTPVGIRYAMPGLVFFALAAGQALMMAGRTLNTAPPADTEQRGAER